ncbi:hypothetical protein HOV93_12910 [Planctomycetes bacterium FF15]|uniref:Uncharacterized protein n=2 Tax=Bremerella alba TaxID=980252 RepID=A0A7V8V3B9_9BACT|nr:hypothetical protein [Bremerella alba]
MLFGSLLGCGNSGPQLPPTVPVTAKVILNGKPLMEAEITFSPVSSGPSSNGQVIQGEVVNLQTNAQKPGVALGEYKVTIYDQPVEFGGRELVPDKYGRLNDGFVATVTEDGPNEFTFALTGH